jgi:catechol 2,3-dioxygenase-like lactoylglutathione lyase family enzyme
MIDHITLTVHNLAKSKAFYEKALAPLGMRVSLGSTDEEFWGFGRSDAQESEVMAGRFFVSQSDALHPLSPNVHIAFRSATRDAVRMFHAEALSAGGMDHGAPGPRTEYGERYYAAFVRDPDGNNIEAVTFATE